MSDGPPPEDFRAKLFRDCVHTGDWRVEKLDDDGESIEVAIFSGGDARERAIRYAEPEHGAFDEIELEPYVRSHEPLEASIWTGTRKKASGGAASRDQVSHLD